MCEEAGDTLVICCGSKVIWPSLIGPKALNVMAAEKGTNPAPLLTVAEIQ